MKLEDSIEAALVTVIVKSDNLDTFCAEQKCSQSSSLFVEDEAGTKSIVPGLVQVTYFKSFGYEYTPKHIVSSVSRLELDPNTSDYDTKNGTVKYTTVPADEVDAFCHMHQCISIGEITLSLIPNTSGIIEFEEVVIVRHWNLENPGPDDPKPGAF